MQSGPLRVRRLFSGGSPLLQKGLFQFLRVRNVHFSPFLHHGLDQQNDQQTPRYDALNVQIKGYDFAVLEKFARHVHRTAGRIGLDVEDAWATPCQNFKVTQLKPESTVVEKEYRLNLYERNVQITDVPSTLLPVFVNIIEASIPPGVTTRIHPHLPEHTEVRYVPDLELKDLKKQLQERSEGKK